MYLCCFSIFRFFAHDFVLRFREFLDRSCVFVIFLLRGVRFSAARSRAARQRANGQMGEGANAPTGQGCNGGNGPCSPLMSKTKRCSTLLTKYFLIFVDLGNLGRLVAGCFTRFGGWMCQCLKCVFAIFDFLYFFILFKW